MLRMIIWMAAVWFTIVFFAGCAQLKSPFASDKTQAIKDEQDKKLGAEKAKTPEITATTYYTTGLLLEQQGDYNGAVEKFIRAVDVDHQCTSAYNHLGLCYMRLRNYDLAEDAFKQALQQSPNMAYLHNNLGFTYLLQNKFTNAEAELKNALAVDPYFPRAHTNLAVALAKQGKAEEALTHFRKASPPPDANFNLAMVLHSQGKFQMAEKYYKLALQYNPDFQPARKGLDQLKQDITTQNTKLSKAE